MLNGVGNEKKDDRNGPGGLFEISHTVRPVLVVFILLFAPSSLEYVRWATLASDEVTPILELVDSRISSIT